jgi:opacity protein-like surface antigen
MRKLCCLLSLCALVFVGRAYGQDEHRPIAWHFDIGYSWTSGTTADYLDDGWTIGGGLTWTPRSDSPFSLLAELHYSGYDATSELVRLANLQSDTVRIDDGDAEVWGLNVNGVYRLQFSERARGYLTAGVGEYYRNVQMTQTVLLAGTYCDPWWGFCYPGVFPGQVIAEEQSTTRFAWNAGVGVEFPMSAGGSWYIDARYHRIETSEPTEFIPLTVGFRF